MINFGPFLIPLSALPLINVAVEISGYVVKHQDLFGADHFGYLCDKGLFFIDQFLLELQSFLNPGFGIFFGDSFTTSIELRDGLHRSFSLLGVLIEDWPKSFGLFGFQVDSGGDKCDPGSLQFLWIYVLIWPLSHDSSRQKQENEGEIWSDFFHSDGINTSFHLRLPKGDRLDQTAPR